MFKGMQSHLSDTWHGRAGTCLFLLDFFGASSLAFLRISSSVELCLPYPELRFLVFGRIRFCMDGSYGFRARKNFSVALFLVVSGRLVSGPAFWSISGISIFVFLFGIFLMDVSFQNCSRKILRSFDSWFFGLLVVCAAVCFAISGISIFAFLSGIRFNGTCQAKLALGKFCGHSMLGFFVDLSFVRRLFRDIRNFDFCLFVRNSF